MLTTSQEDTMLDLRWIRENIKTLEQALKNRQMPDAEISVKEFVEVDKKRRALIQKVESLRAERNRLNKEIGQLKRNGMIGPQIDELIRRNKSILEEMATYEADLKKLEEWIHDWLLRIPNIPHPSVPIGVDEQDNIEVRRWGTPRTFSFQVRDHEDLGTLHRILDLKRASKIAGSRFPLFLNEGALLIFGLIRFMLDLHIKQHGYTQIHVPFLVNENTMTGTGQLPKFKDDLYYIERDDLYLIPTAEVPVTNLFREEILPESDLPLKFVCYSPCFRREAGTYGLESKGLIRQHQFDKVELVQITKPDDSYDALEELTSHAEKVLQLLEIPYRVIALCTGDLGFSAAKTYDIEAWLPSQERWLEVSSCSNFETFQTRRMRLKYRPGNKGKSAYPHSLNGSGLAVGRTFVVLIENFQEADGSIVIPHALRPYVDGLKKLDIMKKNT